MTGWTDVRHTQNFDEVKTQYVVYFKSTIRNILYIFIDSDWNRWYNSFQSHCRSGDGIP